jgi:pyruvate kinase
MPSIFALFNIKVAFLGDLAVEIPMETLANIQKDIVQKCNQAGLLSIPR